MSDLAVLEGRQISVAFEGVQALDRASIEIKQSEVVGLIGPNGAGKTTMLNVLSGFVGASNGRVLFSHSDATRWSPQAFAKVGVARTFQNLRLFSHLTLHENVEVAALGVGVRRREACRRSHELLSTMRLQEKAHVQAATLSHGEEKVLSLARALAGQPRLVLLDEPAAGLTEEETDQMTDTIGHIRAALGCGVLVVEHDMRFIMGVCERIYVFDHGRMISHGSPAEVQSDPAVVEAYLGSAA